MTSEPTSSQFPKSNTYYVLINLQSGTAMGLSGADWRSVIGWPPHLDLSSRSNTGPSLNGNLVEPEPNQQWEFEPIGAGWGLRCVFTKDSWMHLPGQGGSTSRERKMYLKYLVPSTERGLRHESPLLASGFPVVWDVEKVNWAAEGKTDGKKEKYKEDVVVKIRLPRSDGDSRDQLVVDLSNRDSNQDGTKVQLAHELNPTHPCQLWRLVECGRRPSPASAPTPALAPDIANQTNETNENPSTREERDVVKADDTTTTRHGSPASAPTPAPALAPDTPDQTNETNSTRGQRDIVKADEMTTTGHGSASISEPNPNTSKFKFTSTSTSTTTSTITTTSNTTTTSTSTSTSTGTTTSTTTSTSTATSESTSTTASTSSTKSVQLKMKGERRYLLKLSLPSPRIFNGQKWKKIKTNFLGHFIG